MGKFRKTLFTVTSCSSCSLAYEVSFQGGIYESGYNAQRNLVKWFLLFVPSPQLAQENPWRHHFEAGVSAGNGTLAPTQLDGDTDDHIIEFIVIPRLDVPGTSHHIMARGID